MSAQGWMNKVLFIHWVKYYSVLKMGENAMICYNRMNLGTCVLWKELVKKINAIWFRLCKVPGIVKLIEIWSRMIIAAC